MLRQRMQPDVYLDYNGSTPVAPRVAAALHDWTVRGWGNPAAAHPEGRRARLAIDAARASIARGLGAASDEIWFTSGGTESNNWALLGSLPERGGHLIVSAVEHRSVLSTAAWLASRGIALTSVPVDGAGVVAVESVERALRPDTRLVSVMLANNETGVLQPARALGALCRGRGVRYHCDATAALGKIPVDVRELGCDLLSLSSHKLYAPKGCGILYARSGCLPCTLIHGCGQQGGARNGTENTAGAVAFGCAFECLADGEFDAARSPRLRDELWRGIRELCPRAQLNGAGERLPNTLSVAFPGSSAVELQAELGRLGVSVSAGAAASGGAPSHVLLAMGCSAERARSTLRFTLGVQTTSEQIASALQALAAALATCARSNAQA